MYKIAWQIAKAQTFLINKFGQEGYRKLIRALKEKTNGGNTKILLSIIRDKNISAHVKLVAIACLGE